MSPRTWRERLEDILTCARNIESFTAGMSFDAFLDDPRTIRAVAFEFTTMGKAARAIPEEIQEQHPEIPWGKMQGIRNVLGMSIFAWMRKSSGMQARMIFHHSLLYNVHDDQVTWKHVFSHEDGNMTVIACSLKNIV